MKKIIQHYSLQNQLGHGLYSRVYRAINTLTNQEVAVKVIQASKFKTIPKLEEGVTNEINILSSLQPSPHIIRYYDMYQTANNFYFVYQLCNGGTLEKILKNNHHLSEKQTLIYLKQILSAFKILSRHNIMHRDIKPQNLLIHNGIIKVADFGFCKPMQDKQSLTVTMLGSPAYMAPQILLGQQYSIKADIWSLGVVVFQMIYGKFPYDTQSIHQLINSINHNDLVIPSQPKISPILEDLLRRMLVKDSNLRINWQQIFKYKIDEQGNITSPNFDKKYLNSSTVNSQKSSIISQNNEKMKSSWTNNNNPNLGNPQSRNFLQIGCKTLEVKPTKYQIKIVQSPKASFSKLENPIMKNSDNAFERLNTNDKSNSNFLKESSSSGSCYDERQSKFCQRFSRVNSHIKNHSKCIEIMSMAIQLLNYKINEGIILSYKLVIKVKQQLNSFLQSSKRQLRNSPMKGPSNNKNESIIDFIKTIQEELGNMQILFKIFQEQIPCENINQLEKIPMKLCLKNYLENVKLQKMEELHLIIRLIHYIEDNFLLKKNNYMSMTRESMLKEINNKIKKLEHI